MSVANYANRHTERFLLLPDSSDALGSSWVQIVEDGSQLTAKRLRQNRDVTLTKPILVKDSPESVGMRLEAFSKKNVTVRDVADTIGHHHPVHVIDVEHQEELDGWTLADLVEYFEDEERLLYHHKQEMAKIVQTESRSGRRRRKAAQTCINRTASKPRVLNQISLEFSKTPLMDRIASPRFVRDMDWIDHAWPGLETRTADSVYPSVQYYCLTSAGGCYTDFHIDFGGTSVWYHVLQGKKVFCLIPPTPINLIAYEDWLCRPNQAELFLPDMINNREEVLRLTLCAKQTLIIPAGYIHAVYTPEDSIVLGGNFLHGMDIAMQLQVHCIEARTKVQEKFRFPHYLPLHYYAGGMYLNQLRHGTISQREVEGMSELIHALEEWWKVHSSQPEIGSGPSVQSAAAYAAKQNQCSSVDEFLQSLRKEYERVRQHGISPSPDAYPADDAVDNKPKLRLKLFSSHKDDSIVEPAFVAQPSEIDEEEAAPEEKTVMDANCGKLRINISLGARQVHGSSSVSAPSPNTKQKKAKMREDTAWIAGEVRDAEDDDWMPSKAKRKRPKDAAVQSKKPTQAATVSKKVKRNAQQTTTARDRLMKRFR